MPQNFDPDPGDSTALFEQEYVVQPHPQAPYLPYRQKAGRARVYQLRNGQEGQYVALKEFKKLYRTPTLIDSYQNLHRVEDFKGLQAARRRIVLPADPAAQRYPNLQYAMLMPWIHGTTWFDVLGQAREDGHYPDLTIAISLCDRFLEVMEGLEKAGMAHTDISPGNVMVGFDPIDVQLVDLEDMYMPGTDAPPQQTTGASGYRHRSEETTWKPEGDRYAAAVLAAEMLILANPELAREATDEGYFVEHSQMPEGIARFQEARPWLEEAAPEFARVFERSWYADSLEGCPRISELREPIKELIDRPLLTESPKRVETPKSKRPPTPTPNGGPPRAPQGPASRRRLILLLAAAVGVVLLVLAGGTAAALTVLGPGTGLLPGLDLLGLSESQPVEEENRGEEVVEETASSAGEEAEETGSSGEDAEEQSSPEAEPAEQTLSPPSAAPAGSVEDAVGTEEASPEEIPVLNVVGRGAAEARHTLYNAGFGSTTEIVQSDQPEGTVLSTDPEAGTALDPASRNVAIRVSTGPPPPLPPPDNDKADREEAAVESAIRGHYGAIGRGDFEAAYTYFSTDAQRDREGWISNEKASGITDSSINSLQVREVSGNAATAEVDVSFTDKNGISRFRGPLGLVKEGGSWKLDSPGLKRVD